MPSQAWHNRSGELYVEVSAAEAHGMVSYDTFARRRWQQHYFAADLPAHEKQKLADIDLELVDDVLGTIDLGNRASGILGALDK